MKLPSKICTFNESLISKIPLVLNEMKKYDSIPFNILYDKLNGKFNDLTEFLDVLDCVYALGKISYDFTERRISYVV